MERGRKTRRRIVAIGLLAVIALALVIVSGQLTRLAGMALQQAGMPAVSFEIKSISTSGVVLSGIRVGQGLGLDVPELEASFNWGELLRGEVGALKVAGLRLNGEVSAGRLTFGDMDQFLFDQAPASNAPKQPTAEGAVEQALPFRSLLLSDAAIVVKSPNGTVTFWLTGLVARNASHGIDVRDATLSIESPWGEATGRVEAALTSEAVFDATLAVDGGRFALNDMRAEDVFGKVRVSGPLNDLEAFQGDGQLGLKAMNLPYLGDSRALLSVDLADGLLDNHFILKPFDEMWASGEVRAKIDIAHSYDGRIDLTAKAFTADLTRGIASNAFSKGQMATDLSMSMTIAEARNFSTRAMSGQLAGGGELTLTSRLENLHVGGCHVIGGQVRVVAKSHEGGLSLTSADGASLRVRQNMDASEGEACTPLNVDVALLQDQGRLVELSLQDQAVTGEIQFDTNVFDEERNSIGEGAFRSQIYSPYPFQDDGGETVDVSFDIARLTTPWINVSDAALAFQGERHDGRVFGTSRLNTQLSADNDAFALDNGHIGADLSWVWQDTVLTVQSADCVVVGFESVQDRTSGLRGGKTELCMTSKRGVSIAAEDLTYSGDVSVSSKNIASLRTKDGERLQFDAFTLALDAVAETGAQPQTNVTFTAPKALWGNRRIRFEDVALNISGGSAAEGAMALSVAKIVDLEQTERFTPVSFRADGKRSQQSVDFDGALLGRGGLTIEFSGEHDFLSDQGSVRARMIPVSFGQDAQGLADISPVAARYLPEANGTLMAVVIGDWSQEKRCFHTDALLRSFKVTPSASVVGGRSITLSGGQIVSQGDWCATGGEWTQGGSVLLENIDVKDEAGELKRLNTVLNLDQFWPIVTHGEQKIAFAVLNVGIPFTDGTATFEIDRQQRLSVSDAALDWAGGKVRIQPLIGTLASLPDEMELSFEGIQLDRFLALLEVNGLQGEGVFEGSLPIKRVDDEFRIVNGVLRSVAPGVLSYHPSGTVGETAQIAVEALSNFHFTTMSMVVDGGTNTEAVLKIRVEGRNPDFYDGFPVILELTATGEVGRMMNDGLAAYKVPDHIRDRMNRFGE